MLQVLYLLLMSLIEKKAFLLHDLAPCYFNLGPGRKSRIYGNSNYWTTVYVKFNLK